MNASTMKTQEAFVLTRELDAPRERVFRAWTEPSQLARWWGPKGMAVEIARLDLQPGGIFHYSLHTPSGAVMWGKWEYREVEAPARLVFLSSFADDTGATARAPFSAEFPLQVLTEVTFEERDGRTKMTMRGVPHNATEAEQRFFAGMNESMQMGWAGTLEQFSLSLERDGPGDRRGDGCCRRSGHRSGGPCVLTPLPDGPGLLRLRGRCAGDAARDSHRPCAGERTACEARCPHQLPWPLRGTVWRLGCL
jgi:uncharacterized protein YndB with AHSA1/START domain